MRRNYLLKHVNAGKIEGRIEVKVRRGRRRKQLLEGIKETGIYWEFEGGRTKSHSMENWCWKILQTCGKTHDVIMIMIMMMECNTFF